MPRHPTSFENYQRFIEYRNRVQNFENTPVEEAVNAGFRNGSTDLDAFEFRPALPGPYNYTPAEFSTHYLHVDLPPGATSYIDDLTVPRNLLNIPEEFGAFDTVAPETAALVAGESTVEFGPEVAIPASALAYLAFKYPGLTKKAFTRVVGTTLLGNGAYEGLKAGAEIFGSIGRKVHRAPAVAGGQKDYKAFNPRSPNAWER